jgi:predicted TIM-barrel fold metal-dependent hydrolase
MHGAPPTWRRSSTRRSKRSAPDRLLFGSDWPVCTLAASYEAVLGVVEGAITRLSPSEQAAILGGKAVREYRLRDLPSPGRG